VEVEMVWRWKWEKTSPPRCLGINSATFAEGIPASATRANDHRIRAINERQTRGKVYNSGVNSPVPSKPAADNQRPDDQHHHRHAAYAAEASGLLIMAVVLLILTVIRYWREIPWSAR
jgi:hypothetical protein